MKRNNTVQSFTIVTRLLPTTANGFNNIPNIQLQDYYRITRQDPDTVHGPEPSMLNCIKFPFKCVIQVSISGILNQRRGR